MDLETLLGCIILLKTSHYYDTSTRITGITVEDDNIATLWFEYAYGSGVGRIDVDADRGAPSIRVR